MEVRLGVKNKSMTTLIISASYLRQVLGVKALGLVTGMNKSFVSNINRIRLGTQEYVNKGRLLQRCGDDITTLQ